MYIYAIATTSHLGYKMQLQFRVCPTAPCASMLQFIYTAYMHFHEVHPCMLELILQSELSLFSEATSTLKYIATCTVYASVHFSSVVMSMCSKHVWYLMFDRFDELFCNSDLIAYLNGKLVTVHLRLFSYSVDPDQLRREYYWR